MAATSVAPGPSPLAGLPSSKNQIGLSGNRRPVQSCPRGLDCAGEIRKRSHSESESAASQAQADLILNVGRSVLNHLPAVDGVLECLRPKAGLPVR